MILRCLKPNIAKGYAVSILTLIIWVPLLGINTHMNAMGALHSINDKIVSPRPLKTSIGPY